MLLVSPKKNHFGISEISSQQKKWVKNLPGCSAESGGHWANLWSKANRIRAYPKSLEALEIHGFLESFPLLAYLPGFSHYSGLFDGVSKSFSLEHLEIDECSTLEFISSLSSLISLKHLEITDVDRIPSISFPRSLKILRLENFRFLELNFNSLCTVACLEELSILDSTGPLSLAGGIKFCTCLKKLEVSYCRELVRIDDDIIGSLTQLKELSLGGFWEELDEVPGLNSIHLLTSLQKLNIIGWNKLTSLPHQLQHLTSVTHLGIQSFHGVETFPDWLCKLSSLQSLSISSCKKLKNLPTDIQRLSKLERLEFSGCPFLKERYSKDIGPEWSNISHILFIQIDSEVIQDLRYGTNAQLSL